MERSFVGECTPDFWPGRRRPWEDTFPWKPIEPEGGEEKPLSPNDAKKLFPQLQLKPITNYVKLVNEAITAAARQGSQVVKVVLEGADQDQANRIAQVFRKTGWIASLAYHADGPELVLRMPVYRDFEFNKPDSGVIYTDEGRQPWERPTVRFINDGKSQGTDS